MMHGVQPAPQPAGGRFILRFISFIIVLSCFITRVLVTRCPPTTYEHASKSLPNKNLRARGCKSMWGNDLWGRTPFPTLPRMRLRIILSYFLI